MRFLFLLLVLFSTPVFSICKEWLSLSQTPLEMQSQIRRVYNRGLTNDRWHRTRGLKQYAEYLGWRTFFAHLKNLKKGQWWFDMGAGGALSQLEYHGKVAEFGSHVFNRIPKAARLGLANTFAFGIKKPGFYPDLERRYLAELVHQGRHLYIEGLVEDYFLNPERLGTADFLTDTQGPATYTTKIDGVMKLYWDLLKIGGVAMMHVQPTLIISDNKLLGVYEWLRKYLGENVKRLGRHNFMMRKTRKQLRLPELELVYYFLNDTQMIRVFREKK